MGGVRGVDGHTGRTRTPQRGKLIFRVLVRARLTSAAGAGKLFVNNSGAGEAAGRVLRVGAEMGEESTIKIEWPWEMVWAEHVDAAVAWIKEALPPGHELRKRDLYPGIKWDGRMVFIVDDDTAGNMILMDFENGRRWKKTAYKEPALRVFADPEEVAEMIRHDHLAEAAKYSDDGTLKRGVRNRRP